MKQALRLGDQTVGRLDPCAIDRDPKSHVDTVFGLAERFGRCVGPAARSRDQSARQIYDLLTLDDLSYVHKDHAETSVLFELIVARYERRSMLITANQPRDRTGKQVLHYRRTDKRVPLQADGDRNVWVPPMDGREAMGSFGWQSLLPIGRRLPK
jgi:hypothetical protein